jgi:hypothetical protein
VIDEDVNLDEEDPGVIEIIEELIDRIRNIIDLFEGIVHEVSHLATALADIFRLVKEVLGFNRNRETEEDLEVA